MAGPDDGTGDEMTTATLLSAETENEGAVESVPRPTRSRRENLVAAVLTVLAVAAGVTCVFQASEFRSNTQRDDDRSAAVAAAERVAVGLATMRPQTAEADITALADLGTGDFAKQLRTNLENQVELIKTNQISSAGVVRSAGLVSLKGDEAVVAVAIESTVKNKSARNGEQRWYRMTVELQRQESGSWLASEVVFVQ